MVARGLSEAKPLWRPERGRDGGREGGREGRRPLRKTSSEARGLPQSEGHSIGLTLSIALSLCLSFSGPVSLSVLPYTILPTTRSAVKRRASIHSQRCLPRSIPTVTLLFIIIVCSSP